MLCVRCGVTFGAYKEMVDTMKVFNELLNDPRKNDSYSGLYYFDGQPTHSVHDCLSDLHGRHAHHSFYFVPEGDSFPDAVPEKPTEVKIEIDESGNCPYCIKAREEYAEGKQVPLICVDNVTLVGCSRHVFEAARKMVSGGKL